MAMKDFLKTDYIFLNFRIKLAKALIENSYMNDKTYVDPENTRKRQISHILENTPNHSTKYKKGFIQKNINTNNKSVVG